MSFRIEAVHVYAAVGDDDEEGIIGMTTATGWLPFVAADQERLELLRPMAIKIGQITGKQIKLVRFSTREDIETLDLS